MSGRLWVRSPTTSYQRRYKNGTRCFLAWHSAYKDRSGFSLLSNLVQKKRWIPSGMSGREWLPYFFYIFDHLKIIIFFADRIFGITPKLTENVEPITNCTPDAPVHVCILIVKVRRCRTHITYVTFGYYRVSFYDIRIKLFPFSFVLKKTIAEE